MLLQLKRAIQTSSMLLEPQISYNIPTFKILGTLQSTGCYIRLETPEGFLDSPSYPDSYPPGFDCCYDIARLSSHHCGVKLYGTYIEETNGCRPITFVFASERYTFNFFHVLGIFWGLQPNKKKS
jgi:hypothetical protein